MTMVATPGTKIRLVSARDADALARYHAMPADHLRPWEPTRAVDDHTPDAWRTRVADQVAAAAADKAYHVTIKHNDHADIAGLCNFTNVQRGAFQACFMGYSVAQSHQGTGLMTEALSHLIPHMFTHYGLHRIMANYMPRNTRSAHLLARLGFEKEELAKDYLKIAGMWEDHILTSRIADTAIRPQ